MLSIDGRFALAFRVRAPTDALHRFAAKMMTAARRFLSYHDETLAVDKDVVVVTQNCTRNVVFRRNDDWTFSFAISVSVN